MSETAELEKKPDLQKFDIPEKFDGYFEWEDTDPEDATVKQLMVEYNRRNVKPDTSELLIAWADEKMALILDGKIIDVTTKDSIDDDPMAVAADMIQAFAKALGITTSSGDIVTQYELNCREKDRKYREYMKAPLTDEEYNSFKAMGQRVCGSEFPREFADEFVKTSKFGKVDLQQVNLPGYCDVIEHIFSKAISDTLMPGIEQPNEKDDLETVKEYLVMFRSVLKKKGWLKHEMFDGLYGEYLK